MAVTETYRTSYDNIEGSTWEIYFSTTFIDVPVIEIDPSKEFTALEKGHELEYQGSNETLFDPIKFSSLRFSIYLESSADLTEIEKIIDNPDQTWYVTLFFNDVLDWYGYLKVDVNFKFNNQPFPRVVAFEANDVLTVMKDARISDFISPGGTIVQSPNNPYGGIGAFVIPTVLLLRFGFGNVGSFLSQTPHNDLPKITEIIWCLLFDLDDNLPGKFSVMTGYDHPKMLGLEGPLDDIRAQINQYVFKEFRAAGSIDFFTDTKVIKLLSDVMELIGSRIFLSNGRYWITQIRSYLASPFFAYNYDDAGANNGPNFVNGSSTLPNISTGQINVSQKINHFQKAGGNFEFIPPLQEVRTRGISFGDEKDQIAFVPVSDTVVNYSNYTTKKEKVGLLDFDVNADMEVFITGSIWRKVSIISDVPGGNLREWMSLVSFQRMEAQNQVIKKIKMSIYSDELRFFHMIRLDNEDYLIDRMTYNGNDARAEIEATFLGLNATGIKVAGEEVDEPPVTPPIINEANEFLINVLGEQIIS